MDAVADIVIVGAGIAGASAAETLRREGYAGRITLIGAEPVPPYERPPLSKEFLLGREPESRLFPRSEAEYAALDITLRLSTRATALDAAARTVTLASGDTVPYDGLLIATGSAPRALPVPGASLPGVRVLRTLADARALASDIREAAATGRSVVIAGAGFIGMEVAACCRELGAQVTVVEPLSAPMERALGTEIGGMVAAYHRARGVDLRLGASVVAFEGAGRVETVVIGEPGAPSGGERLPCALALVAVGVRPEDEWLRDSGLALADGVEVDEHCATAIEGVYAAGDIASWPYSPPGGLPNERVRIEHWDNALRQPEVAARNLLGGSAVYAPVPYFWSDQFALKLQMVGFARRWDRLITRGTLEDGTLVAFYLLAGRIAAALAVNRPRDLVTLKRLVGTAPDPAALADPAIELRALAQRMR
jgi:3-phenylpropionate/trans-cinnamate dioxygenase ferredoxin reductase subunit